MNALAHARDLLRAEGCICSDAADGSLLFAGAVGRGRVGETAAGELRVHYDVSAVADDPLVYARMSSRSGPVRITLCHRAPVAELRCPVTALTAALRGIVGLWAPDPCPALPIVDLALGVLEAVAPPLVAPAFVRLFAATAAPPAAPVVDRARATYLLTANARLRSGKGGWRDGPGLTVDPAYSDRTTLGGELFEVGHALQALGEERIARSYLELCGMKSTIQPRGPIISDRTATTKEDVS
jgi:hypothetical protein